MPITISGTTGISGVDGSASTPAIIGSDADTGLVFAAGEVTASLNGTASGLALMRDTSKASTSGTSVDFTGIPSWVKRITVTISGVSTNGTSPVEVRMGTSAGIEATGYDFTATAVGTGANSNTTSTGFSLVTTANAQATNVLRGVLTLFNHSGNVWIATCQVANSPATVNFLGGGSKGLAGTLDRIRITTVNGTDTFDAGSINILFE
jgi:hypothetical protein